MFSLGLMSAENLASVTMSVFKADKPCLQAGDLRRLLELYIGWQQRIFPYASFDAFVEGLEKLGSSHVLKV